MPVTIWHNPRCATSRRVLGIIRNKGIEPHVVEYLKTPPSAKEIKAVLAKLKLGARDLLRRKEAAYGAEKLDDETLSDAAIIRAMTEHPVLIERPVVLAGRRAVLADRVDDLAVLAVLALRGHRKHRVQRGDEEQHRECQPEDEARHDQDEIEDRRERLPVQQQSERRQEDRKQIDHRRPRIVPSAYRDARGRR